VLRGKQIPLCVPRPSRGRGAAKKKRATAFGMTSTTYFPRTVWSTVTSKAPS